MDVTDSNHFSISSNWQVSCLPAQAFCLMHLFVLNGKVVVIQSISPVILQKLELPLL